MKKLPLSIFDDTTCWRDPNAKSIGFFAAGLVSSVDQSLLAELKDMAIQSGENVRLSLHENKDAAFHEMIIVQHRDRFHPPKKHSQKAKSFHVMEGEMAVFSFEDDGKVSNALALDGQNSFIFRAEKNVYHADFPITELVVHHESTLGPFLGDSDSEYPNWAPLLDDQGPLIRYRDELFAEYNMDRA